MLASGRNGTLYVGVTSDVVRRIWEHKMDAVDGFTKKYSIPYAGLLRMASSIVS
ncbi:MAG: hypothetical protein EPN20_11395 [Magnetospirillum sp.]|nr:MAG: hypothetical protein EPN20_11395 [Magnetospirillum sp.]